MDLAKGIRGTGTFIHAFMCLKNVCKLFEELPAKDVSAAQAYLTEVADTDVYLGLFGESYGYEDHEGTSPTEREYDCATANHKYRIVLIKAAEQRHPKEAALIRKAEQDVAYSVLRKHLKVFLTLVFPTDWNKIRIFATSNIIFARISRYQLRI